MSDLPTQGVIGVITIYFSPSDFPGLFVVRKHVITHLGHIVYDDKFTLHEDLQSARGAIPRGLVNIGRMDDDQPQIVESWI